MDKVWFKCYNVNIRAEDISAINYSVRLEIDEVDYQRYGSKTWTSHGPNMIQKIALIWAQKQSLNRNKPQIIMVQNIQIQCPKFTKLDNFKVFKVLCFQGFVAVPYKQVI